LRPPREKSRFDPNSFKLIRRQSVPELSFDPVELAGQAATPESRPTARQPVAGNHWGQQSLGSEYDFCSARGFRDRAGRNRTLTPTIRGAKQSAERFPEDFLFRLSRDETEAEPVTVCDPFPDFESIG